jgi:hypothetical protein
VQLGVAPPALTVVPKGKPVQAGGQMGSGTIQDFAPNVNIIAVRHVHHSVEPASRRSHLCRNGCADAPAVAFRLTTPWKPGSPTVQINGAPVDLLTNSCTCQCSWGGVITISSPGQKKTMTA